MKEIREVVIGMEVVCVDGSKHCSMFKDLLTEGDIYIVESACISTGEVRLKGIDFSWSRTRFEAVPKSKCVFHVGQPVRRSRNTKWNAKSLVDGEVGIIFHIGEPWEVKIEGKGYWNHDSATLKPAYKLEVGCRVRVVGYDGYNAGFNGIEGLLQHIQGDWATIIDKDNKTNYQFNSNNLIVLEPAPRKIEKGGMAYIAHDHPIGKAIPDTLNGTWNPDNYDKLLMEMLEERTKQHQKLRTISTPHSGTSGHAQSDDSIFTYEDIQKAMEDIKKEPIDKYGLMALETLSKQDAYATLGIDWGGMKPSTMEIQRKHLVECSIGMIASILDLRKKIEDLLGGNKMSNEKLQELAKKMNDELVGQDEGFGSIFLKNAGEVETIVRNIKVSLTESDIKTLLKQKGIDKALGEYAIDQSPSQIDVTVFYLEPIKKEEPENEED